ncbi:anibiotic ABC transporter [Rhodococcus sp. AD45-ID]|uniref:ABC-2 type transport system permease protein n=1 Tax=Nocardia globerula TaxID=1818 RepID=A0A652YWX5_NOCGL|nr:MULTISPECIES: anibiotic ABC transporter [Rhodococcus]KJF20443.1 ABC-2 family transporter protein [Rhodococcus sp. AD45]NMD59451.1 anibiotic ABC transporter [Nocardia globerula]PSR41504.1 anibiotic ABC transporter [Rhodococcus sp. AD45-ID]PVX64477.1 ABC-2 type transport system permease protein [Rhodococcus globerulus]
MTATISPVDVHQGTQFTGTSRLVRLALRRDRIQLPVWLISLTVFLIFVAASVGGLYSTPEELRSVAVGSAVSPVALATNGIVSGYSEGAIVASQGVLVFALAAALMSTLAVVRHTRQNEETGRAEMIGAAVVGRRALLTSALVVTIGANIVLALASAIGLVAIGLPADGSLALGAAIGGTGIAFAGVAAVAAQITDGARTANGIAGAAIGIAFMLRAIGDVDSTVVDDGTRVVSGWMSWLSPIGWAQQIRPYDDNAWWILLLLFGFAVVHIGIAFVLIGHRDQGAGLVQPRPGPPVAARWLPSAWGLAWRMQRVTMFWWLFSVVILGFSYGAVGNEIDQLVGSSQQTADLFEQLGGGSAALVDSYLATALGFLSIVIAAYAVQSILRMHGEESSGRLEPLLSTALPRWKWMLSHVSTVVGGVVLAHILAGVFTGFAFGLVTDDIAGNTVRMAGAALAYLPAVLVVLAVVALVFGLFPAIASSLSWGIFAACIVLGQFGVLFKLPQVVLDLSPFTHVPTAPAEAVTALPLVVLTALALALGASAIAAFARRDIRM